MGELTNNAFKIIYY